MASKRSDDDSGIGLFVFIGVLFIAVLAAGAFVVDMLNTRAEVARLEALEARAQALAEIERTTIALRSSARPEAEAHAEDDGDAHHDHAHDDDNVDPEVSELRKERAELRAQLDELASELEAAKAELLKDG